VCAGGEGGWDSVRDGPRIHGATVWSCQHLIGAEKGREVTAECSNNRLCIAGSGTEGSKSRHKAALPDRPRHHRGTAQLVSPSPHSAARHYIRQELFYPKVSRNPENLMKWALFSNPEREREIYFKSHISLWEHSSHFRLIGRGVPSVSVVSQLMYLNHKPSISQKF